MLKLNFKTVFLCALTLAASAAHASDAFYFFNPQNRIGCATITSVRNVNQAPLYDREYEMLMGGRGGSANLAIIVSGLGIVGAAGAVAASLAIDAVRDPSVAVDGVQTPADCPRRSKFEPPCRLNIEPGVEADFERVGCG